MRVAPRTFPEVRALWVVRNTLSSPGRVMAMVDRAHRAGFNTLIVQVRGRGDAWYRSDLEPAADPLSGQPAGFDPLALALQEAHARGMAVHAWVNAQLVGAMAEAPTDPAHVLRTYPDALAVPRPLARELYGLDPASPGYLERVHEWSRAHDDRVEGLFASPSHPGARERFLSVVEDLARRYDVDGVHFDYIRYPSELYDYSRGALEAFRAWLGPRLDAAALRELDRALASDPLAAPELRPEEFSAFRREQIDRTVAEAGRRLRAVRPGLVVSAAVFPMAAEARRWRFQDWARWVEEGWLDVVAPMAYTGDDARFRRQAENAVRTAGGERVWLGIGVYLTTLVGTLDRIDVARELDAAGVSLFSYDWAVASGESSGGVPFLERVGRASFAGR